MVTWENHALISDLEKLPPGSTDVLLCLGAMPDATAPATVIMEQTGLSERIFRKVIRRLVTRYYVSMSSRDVYALTKRGRDAVSELGTAVIAEAPLAEEQPATVNPPAPTPDSPPATVATSAPPIPEPPPPAAPAPSTSAPAAPAAASASPAPQARHPRRLSIFVPKQLVAQSTALLRAGFDGPKRGAPALRHAAHVVLRLSAPHCSVEPPEVPLDISPAAAAGPVKFRVAPEEIGSLRLRLEVYQRVDQDELVLVGGMFFDIDTGPFPTSASAEFVTLGAVVPLYPGPTP